MEITVFYSQNEYKVLYATPVKLSEVIQKAGVSFSMPCGGLGKCGKCVVKASGCVSGITDNEKAALGDKIKEGYRLACETFAVGDCRVFIAEEGNYAGVSDFDIDYNIDPMTGNDDCYAGVVDIGTTTVAAYLYKMPECVLVNSSVNKNEQSSIGADVLSRISYSVKNGSGYLSEIIRKQIDSVFADFGKKPALTVVTGNTSMLHLYNNLPCDPLSIAPFEPRELFGYSKNGICIPRCVSAFAGADITCGIIASGMMENERSMLIDIGTNCEIVYKNENEYICCSAAAGPAFEGAGITNGSASVPGAINKVYNIGYKFEYTTINRDKPVSICGSGLIDAIASMLRCEIIDESGFLESDFRIGDSGVSITPSDIRQVQTAKAAVRAAIETVCDDLTSVEKFYLSGSFGNYLNIDNAIAIGLLPRQMKNKTVLCGNTAAAGAAMILFDKNKFTEANTIAGNAKTLQLASNDEFYKKYIGFMNF